MAESMLSNLKAKKNERLINQNNERVHKPIIKAKGG
jgi:hypothetical protein